MPDLRLTFACGLYDRVLPLYTKQVRPKGVDLQFLVEDNPREIFDKMAREQAFDLSEFSTSEYIQRFAAGECPFVALPIFPSRMFRHALIFVNRRYIKKPKDLEGKRIGVPLYTMTAAIFQKGLLSDEHGVDFSGVEWLEGDINSSSPHGNPTILPTARKVAIAANRTGKSLSALLSEGSLQALIGAGIPDSYGRDPDIVRLYPDYRSAEIEYYGRTKIFPIMHTLIMKREVHDANPGLAATLTEAFSQAKQVALEKMRYRGTLRYMLPFMHAELDDIARVFGGDPWPYGIRNNRPTLEALVRYLTEQGVIARAPKVEELFFAGAD